LAMAIIAEEVDSDHDGGDNMLSVIVLSSIN